METSKFGLRVGQKRMRDLEGEHVWYSREGEILGVGELAKKDIAQIQEKLDPGEIFVMVRETDAFLCSVSNSLGQRYVYRNANFIVTKNCVYKVCDTEIPIRTYTHRGISVCCVSREESKILTRKIPYGA